ncbi:MAG: hypothetical protein JWN73_350 [Betaproteobacteria bacterium]|nr:hypothetical protein [Betaproteobacteria bacterium]
MTVMTGLSGNELYCLSLKGYTGGDLVLGNSVHSMGFLGGIGSAFQSAFGGEVTQITDIIADGRRESYKRMVEEATRHGGVGITSVTNSLRHFQGNIEFLSVASCLHKAADGEMRRDPPGTVPTFTTSGSGQALYCLIDAGYTPKKFVFGNVAYSVGIGGGLLGGLKSMARGEIREFSDIFNRTRHAALDRVTGEARRAGANCVLGIVTEVGRFQGAHEMLMTGTAAHHPGLPAFTADKPATSDLTCEELWNLTAMGYAPVKLVLATAVYSLGVVGNVKSLFKSFVRGEISDLTSLIYDAREHALAMLHDEAKAIGADEVVGIKTHIHELGSLIEFMAVGTAVKKMPGFSTATAQLPPQAIMTDRDTWISSDYFSFNTTE